MIKGQEYVHLYNVLSFVKFLDYTIPALLIIKMSNLYFCFIYKKSALLCADLKSFYALLKPIKNTPIIPGPACAPITKSMSFTIIFFTL